MKHFIKFAIVIVITSCTVSDSNGSIITRKRFLGELPIVGGIFGGGRRGGYGGGGSGSRAEANSYNRNIGGCVLFNLVCLKAGASGAHANADSNSGGGGGYGGGSGSGANVGASSWDGGSAANAGGNGWNFG